MASHTRRLTDDSSNPHLGFSQAQPPLSQLFQDAALYNRVLHSDGRKSYDLSPTMLDRNESVVSFAELVGQDLDEGEKTASGRFAQFAAADWLSDDEEETGEPESYEDDDGLENSTTSSPPSTPVPDRSSEVADSGYGTVNEEDAASSEEHRLTPEEIVDVLVQEFGSLTEGNEEEHLIKEGDGAFLQDVSILGVLHLTSHRLAFHASLLATRPDLGAQDEIIKAGPTLVRRKGLVHRSRRVWMELSHDTVSLYPSSRPEDRIKPLRSIFLSSIKDISHIEEKHPRSIRVSIEGIDGARILEFDTEESARDWRREMQGALFLFRHRKHADLDQSQPDTQGIRMSIPLDAIIDFKVQPAINEHAWVLSLAFPPSEDSTGSLAETARPDRPRVIQFATLKSGFSFDDIGYYIGAAKSRHAGDDTVGRLAPIVVDFGPLTFLDNRNQLQEATEDPMKTKDSIIRKALAFDAHETMWTTRARLRRGICTSGYLAVVRQFIGFWSKSCTGLDDIYRIPVSIVKSVKPIGSLFSMRDAGLVIEIIGQADLKFDFPSEVIRDAARGRILEVMEADLERVEQSPSSPSSPLPQGPVRRSSVQMLAPLSRAVAKIKQSPVPIEVRDRLPKVLNLPKRSLSHMPAKHFVCLTIGSRGDIQPYIALCRALRDEGHRTTIVTHEEFKEWIESFGIEHRTAGGDPGALMKLSVEHKMFSPQFFKEGLTNFRDWLDQLLLDAWAACIDADVLLESPSAMAGVHIAEALSIPYFRTFTMPWTKTKEFPHAFISPPVEAPTANAASYVLFDNVLWAATSGQINRWRRESLGLAPTDMSHLAQSKIPFIYNFSQAVVPKPLDWGDATVISGYWFLDDPDPGWSPSETLLRFIDSARKENKALVYIGFGSITVPDPVAMTEAIVQAVVKSGVRAIISKGWSARMSKAPATEVALPEQCMMIDKVPHDWLFPRIDAALHHGGAGTTGASLRAGIPTLIKPWFGDQYFWASRVHSIGAGMRVSLRVNELADAFVKATTSRRMKEKAALIGQRIRAEDGVHVAIQTIRMYMTRAGQDRTQLH